MVPEQIVKLVEPTEKISMELSNNPTARADCGVSAEFTTSAGLGALQS